MRPGFPTSLTSPLYDAGSNDQRLKAWPRGLRRCVAASLRSESQEYCVSFLCVANWICDFRFAEACEPQETGIAFAAGETFGRRIVATVGEREIDAEFDGFANDFGF